MKIVYCFIFLFVLASCTTNSNSDNSQLYETTKITGADAEFAIIRNEGGRILEKGTLKKGIREGSWITYHDDQRLKSLSNYINGKLNGIHLEFNNRGQMEFEANFQNNEYHGLVAKYSFGRPIQELNYKNGKLDGPFAEYSTQGKLKKKGEFKNDKQHGTLEFYNDDEVLIMKYEYNNGKKLSGGIVEKKDNVK